MSQAIQAIDLTLPVGRLVGGHPLRRQPKTDDDDKPVMDAQTGQQVTEAFLAVAIPKGPGETHWANSEWGAQIWQKGHADWPRGEAQAATFAWKVTDGDSTAPNKNGKIPAEREGWPGHWVLSLSTRLQVQCFYPDKYSALEQIRDEGAIKPGDYVRVLVQVKGNGPCKSPGVYVNPKYVELTRVGQEIQLQSGPSAAEAFGGAPAQLPAGALVDNSQPAAPAAPVPPGAPAPAAPVPQAPAAPAITPAPDFLRGGAPAPAPAPGAVPPPPGAPAPAAPAPAPAPEPRYSFNGQVYTRAQLLAAKWADAQIDALPQV